MTQSVRWLLKGERVEKSRGILTLSERAPLQFLVHFGGGIPESFIQPLYELEFPIFGGKYAKCPLGPEETRRRYGGQRMVAVFCTYGGQLVGARLFRGLTEKVVESMVMMVHTDHRGKGIAGLLCATVVPVLRAYGFDFVTSWTHVNLSAAQILARYCPFVSAGDALTPLEERLLRLSEADDGQEPGAYGAGRRVAGFFQMCDGSCGDANFWVHDLRTV